MNWWCPVCKKWFSCAEREWPYCPRCEMSDCDEEGIGGAPLREDQESEEMNPKISCE